MTTPFKFLPRLWLGLALSFAGSAHALPVSFTIDGVVSGTSFGYTAGDAIFLTAVLDSSATSNVRTTPAGTTCCASSVGWYEDLPDESHLWSGLSGTDISGTWSFPVAYHSTSSLTMVVTSPWSGFRGDTFQMQGTNHALTMPSGLFAGGFPVIHFQVSAVFLDLSAVRSFGEANVFSATIPDATDFFASMAGTYDRDPLFTALGRIRVLDPTGGTTIDFVPNRLTITVGVGVPESGTWALMLGGLAVIGAFARRPGSRSTGQLKRPPHDTAR